MTDRKNPNHRIVLWQAPNLPLIVWASMRVLAWPLAGKPEHLAQIIAFGAIFTWAWLEIFQGINLFRRALGLLILILAISSVR